MKTIQTLAAFAALCAATLSASSASLSVRETASTVRDSFPNQPKDADSIHGREVRADVSLSPAELANEPVLQIYYVPHLIPGRGPLDIAEVKLDSASSSTTQKLEFKAVKSSKKTTAWAARVIVGGKPVAWAAENEKALAWIKALEVKP